jgi:hypothetical protein
MFVLMQKYIKYAPEGDLVYNLVEVQSEGCFFCASIAKCFV